MNSPPADGNDEAPRSGVLGRIWGVLRRDVRTFMWRRPNPLGREIDDGVAPDFKALSTPVPAIASEVDPGQIAVLQFRREVLDWRDEFHYQVTETAYQAKTSLAEQVEHELANMNFLRLWLFTKPASEILAGHIEACVQSPMRRTTQMEEAALRQRLTTWLPHREESVSIMVMWPKLEWDTRLALKFTADNREHILKVLDEMILGENGLANGHRQWATRYATKILEMRYVHPDSI